MVKEASGIFGIGHAEAVTKQPMARIAAGEDPGNTSKVLRRVSSELRYVCPELRNVSPELRNVSSDLRNVSSELRNVT